MKVTKKAKLEFLRKKLGSDKRWCLNGLRRIAVWQTEEEKINRATIELNGKGFTKVHANIVTGLLKFYDKNNFLTEKQWETLLKIAPRYAGQLFLVSDQEILSRQTMEDLESK